MTLTAGWQIWDTTGNLQLQILDERNEQVNSRVHEDIDAHFVRFGIFDTHFRMCCGRSGKI